MADHMNQYEFVVLEDGKRLDGRVIHDPFIVTHLEFHQSRWDAFKAMGYYMTPDGPSIRGQGEPIPGR